MHVVVFMLALAGVCVCFCWFGYFVFSYVAVVFVTFFSRKYPQPVDRLRI